MERCKSKSIERNLTLFFTYGITLKIWDERGLLSREIILYKKLFDHGLKVTFITYGDESDYQYCDKLGDIKIIPCYAFVKRPLNKIIRFIQSFFLPFILKDQLKNADILKTNQMSMTWAPLLSKILFIPLRYMPYNFSKRPWDSMDWFIQS